MKKPAKITIFAVLCIAVTAIIVLIATSKPSGTNQEKVLPGGELLYDSTAQDIRSSNEFSYQITEVLTVTDGETSHTEHSVKTAHIHKPNDCYYTEEVFTIGKHQITTTELFTDGHMYLTVEGGKFVTEITAKDFTDRTAPLLLISPELYKTVQAYETADGILIRYQDGTSSEPWFSVIDATYLKLYGAVLLDKNGNFSMSTYELTYRIGSKVYHHYYLTKLVTKDSFQFPVPDDKSAYTLIERPDTILALERASGYLISAESVGTNYSDRISCEVFGDVREQSISLQTHTLGDWSAQMNTTFTLSNATKAGADTTVTQSETFKNGTYTISINGSEPQQNPEITAETMKKHCHNLLVGTIALPYHITEVTANQSPNTQYIEFTLSEDFAQILREELSQILYQNSNLFSNYEDNYATDLVTGHLTIDTHTGLPLSSGFQYRGVYTIDGMPYALEYSADQTYTYPPA